MAGFLIDEDLPPSLVGNLSQADRPAVHVQDLGLRGQSDKTVFAYAVQHHLTLVTRDLGFATTQVWQHADHEGVILVRMPNEVSIATIKGIVATAIHQLPSVSLKGTLVVIEPNRIRISKA